MQLFLIWLGKAIQKTSRLFHNSGAALPGLVVEKLSPGFLEKALRRLPDGVIVISGTNGKTTTTKLVADTLTAYGDRVLTNRTGSNMTRGLISTVISRSSITGRLPFSVAVLEVDEAYAAVLAKKVPIKAALVLNIMRDQLDRFGEIDATAGLLAKLTKAADSIVVLNGDDSRVAKLPTKRSAKRIDFGGSAAVKAQLLDEDSWHASSDKKESMAQVVLEKSKQGQMKIKGRGEITPAVEGVHNHMNITAAFSLLSALMPEKSPEDILSQLAEVKPAFGRGETISVGDSSFDVLLVKNPSSFVQTIMSANVGQYDTVTVVINDAYADSRDVSWLWDVDIEGLRAAKKLFVGGSRGADMAVRLKYDENLPKKVLNDESTIVAHLSKIKGSHAVLCTYTAMLKLRKELVRLGHTEQVV